MSLARPVIVAMLPMVLISGCAQEAPDASNAAPPEPAMLAPPTAENMPMQRSGAALYPTHPEFVLRLAHAPATPSIAAITTPTADFRTSPVSGATLTLAPSAPAADTHLTDLAKALHRYCNHWPFGDDLNLLVRDHVITPGSKTETVCTGGE